MQSISAMAVVIALVSGVSHSLARVAESLSLCASVGCGCIKASIHIKWPLIELFVTEMTPLQAAALMMCYWTSTRVDFASLSTCTLCLYPPLELEDTRRQLAPLYVGWVNLVVAFYSFRSWHLFPLPRHSNHWHTANGCPVGSWVIQLRVCVSLLPRGLLLP